MFEIHILTYLDMCLTNCHQLPFSILQNVGFEALSHREAMSHREALRKVCAVCTNLNGEKACREVTVQQEELIRTGLFQNNPKSAVSFTVCAV